MAENKTLVLTIPGTVSDNSIPKLGQRTLQFKTNNNVTNLITRVRMRFKEPVIITSKDGSNIFSMNSDFSSPVNTLSFAAEEYKVFYVFFDGSGTTKEVDVSSIYMLETFWVEGSLATYGYIIPAFNLENLKYCTYLRNLQANRNQIYGDIANLKLCPVDQNLLLPQSTNVTGDVAALVGKNLTNVDLSYSAVYGDASQLTISGTKNFTGTNVTGV